MSGRLEVYELAEDAPDPATLDVETGAVLRVMLASQAAAREDGLAWVVSFTALGPFGVRYRSVDGWAQRRHPAYIVTKSGGPAADAATRALARAMDAWVSADAEMMRGHG